MSVTHDRGNRHIFIFSIGKNRNYRMNQAGVRLSFVAELHDLTLSFATLPDDNENGKSGYELAVLVHTRSYRDVLI